MSHLEQSSPNHAENSSSAYDDIYSFDDDYDYDYVDYDEEYFSRGSGKSKRTACGGSGGGGARVTKVSKKEKGVSVYSSRHTRIQEERRRKFCR